MNDPTGTSDRHSAYFDAVRDADEALGSALAAVRAEEDAHRISVAAAADERCTVLERHLADCQRLRRELLGGS
jgi:hypothetical protein